MDTVFIGATNQCNKTCPHCYYVQTPRTQVNQVLDTATLLNFIAAAAAEGVRNINFTGGEPMLHQDIFTLLRRVRMLDMECLLLTNGELIDLEEARELANIGVSIVSLSLNDLAIVDETSLQDALDAYTRRLTIWRAGGMRAIMGILVLTRSNYKFLEQVLRFAAHNRIGLFIIPVYSPTNSPYYEQLSLQTLTTAEWDTILPVLYRWGERFNSTAYYQMIAEFYGPESRKPTRCLVGQTVMVIDYDGGVYPCFHRMDIHLGSILEDSAATLIQRSKLCHLEHNLSQAECFGEECIPMLNFYAPL